MKTNECPVSFITGRSARLVSLWKKAEIQHTTLATMLDSDEAWIEDVEELLASQQDLVKATFEKESEKQR